MRFKAYGHIFRLQLNPVHVFQTRHVLIPLPSKQRLATQTSITFAMSSTKKARTHPPYELLYWPGIPGRGEFIRLVFEASGVSYKDVANESEDGTIPPLASLGPLGMP